MKTIKIIPKSLLYVVFHFLFNWNVTKWWSSVMKTLTSYTWTSPLELLYSVSYFRSIIKVSLTLLLLKKDNDVSCMYKWKDESRANKYVGILDYRFQTVNTQLVVSDSLGLSLFHYHVMLNKIILTNEIPNLKHFNQGIHWDRIGVRLHVFTVVPICSP